MSIQRVVTVADPNVTVVVFSKSDGSADVVITGSIARHSSTVHVPKPPAGMRLVTKRFPAGEVEITYESED